MPTPLNEADRQSYLTRFKVRYKKFLGREASDQELQGFLDSREHADAALDEITNSPEYLALKESNPTWFNSDGSLKTGYTNQGAGGGAAGGTTSGGNTYGSRANVDRTYIESQVRDAYRQKGVDNPSQSDVDYWVNKASKPDLYSDNKWRVGWNDYYKQRLITGSASADPRLAGDEGVIDNPSQYGLSTSIDLNAPLNQQYGGTMPTVPTTAPLPDIPQAPAFQAPTWQSVYEDPGYKFAIQQGTEATQNAQAAKGMLHSGATLKALSNLGQQTATQFYNDAYNRGLGTYNVNYQTQYRDPYTARVNQWQLGNDAAQQQYQNQWGQYAQGYNQFRNWQNDVWNRQFGYANA